MEPQYQTILNKADPYLDVIRAATSKYNLDLPKFISQIAQESSFNPNAMSKAGAVGISQFMPATAKMYGLTDRTDPVASIEAQARHMSDLLNANNGNYDLALAAYNAGQGRVNKAGGIPNIRETKDYIKKINLMSEGLSKMLHPDLQDQLNQPATVPNQQLQPAATVPFAQQNTQKKGTLVDTITALMAGLGGLGGNVANIIGGIKGTGSPGDQALKSSAGLLEVLSANQEKARNAQRINDFFNQSNASPEMKNAAMALAKMGDTKGAMDLLTQPYKEQSAINKAVAIDVAKAKNPELIKLQEDKDRRALEFYKNKELFGADLKTKTDLEKSKAPAQQLDVKLKLIKDFRADPSIKNTREVASKAKMVNAAWENYLKGGNDKSRNALDQQIILAFNRMNEPDSVTRESEFARTPEGVAVFNRLQGGIEKLQKGGLALTDADRKEIIDSINLMSKSQEEFIQPLMQQYNKLATDVGLDPNELFYTGSNPASPAKASNNSATSKNKPMSIEDRAKSLGATIRIK